MRVAIVTGASRGIGRSTALALADAGFALGLVARSSAALDQTRRLVEERGSSALTVVADVRDARAMSDAVGRIEGDAGPVAALVNNAGTLGAVGPLWEVDPDDWWRDVETSLGGVFNLCREVVPGMLERGSGHIVNVTSYAAVRPAPYETGYAAGKAAVISLTEALAASLENYGVKVFAVAPGFTQTEMTRNLQKSEAGRRWLPNVGRGRVVDDTRSAELIAALASGQADQLNGRVLHTLDDMNALRGSIDAIQREDLYVPRVRRLPTPE